MRRLLGRRLATRTPEAGYTLIELLVASAMGIVLLGAFGSMLISSMRSQPEKTKRAQAVSTARWVTERMTREIRNGVAVDEALATKVSFRTYLRRTTCGASTVPASSSPSIECRVTYTCTTTSCTRNETAPAVVTGGTPRTLIKGIDDSNVFTYSPSAANATFIGITLHFPNPTGPADLTVSDGASLRNATLGG
jgi:type II secretory pathway pseudopilin PulG